MQFMFIPTDPFAVVMNAIIVTATYLYVRAGRES
jgi:hypothetical protein